MESRERELFEYRDGKLYWKKSTNSSITVGQEAGTYRNSDGYHIVGFDGKNRRIHRVIWAYHYGEIEEGVFVDHINRDPFDNRIENLRLCNKAQNNANSKVRSDNNLGIKGVCVSGSKFRARVSKQGKEIHLGNFDTIEEAHAAYLKAAEEVFGEFACGG